MYTHALTLAHTLALTLTHTLTHILTLTNTHVHFLPGVNTGHFATAESAKQQRQPGLGKVQGTHV